MKSTLQLINMINQPLSPFWYIIQSSCDVEISLSLLDLILNPCPVNTFCPEMSPAYDVCCISSVAFQTNFIMEANTVIWVHKVRTCM